MLLSASAIASAVEVVSREDFYKPAHGHIFEAITSLYGSGEPIDPVTVAEELRRANLLDAIGGPAVLVDLQATTPAISNAGGYAHIVEEHALLRRLIGVAGEIAELGYSVPDDVTKAVDRAEAMVYDVAQRRVADTMSPVHDLLEISLSRLEQLYDRGESITGLPTGYNDLDELLSGLQPSSLVVVGARPSVGKCVAWDTPILDPVTGALRTAAEVHRIGTAGHPVAVASLGGDGSLTVVEPEAFVDDGIKPVFRVRTRSGREVRTTITHPFLTERGWLPLGDLGVGVRVAVPHALPFFGSDRLPAAEVVLLAHLVGHGQRVAGGAVFANTSPTVVADLVVHADGQGVRAVPLPSGHVAYRVVAKERARDRIEVVAARHGLLGVANDRGMPDAVFRLPHDQLALFLGRLFATAGTARAAARGAGRIRYLTASRTMAQGVQHLLLRFGVAAAMREKRVCEQGVTHDLFELEVTDAADIRAFCDQFEVVGQERSFEVLSRRAGGAGSGLAVGARAKWPRGGGSIDLVSGGRRPAGQVLERAPDPRSLQHTALWDEIVEIEYDGMDQVYDLTVPVTHNFVAGDVFVHNTAFALGMAAHAALEAQRPVLFFSLEMGHLELTQRLLSMEARVDSSRLRNGRLVEADWSKIGHAIGRLANAPLWIDENPNVTVMEIRAKARRLKSRIGDLGLVVVDYLQLMSGRGSAENRQVEVSEISRGLKILARELETPVVALSQLSRGLELRAEKRPVLADLRESGCLSGDTLVTRADTGMRVPIGELATSGERDIPVWTLNEHFKLVPAVMTHAFSSGVKPVFEVSLASGRRVRASGNHPFLRFDGWTRGDELRPGDRLAVAGRALRELVGARCAGDSQVAGVPNLAGFSPENRRAAPGLHWDTVREVEVVGEEEVFDATVPGTHNFLANGVVVHNSIEQDADVVVFLYRDEVHNPDSPDIGTAEILVAKHRSGPTGKVKLAYLSQYTRFANMARGV
jgi:replicative DNA helicase